MKRAWTALTLPELDKQMETAISGRPSITGVNINRDTAMNYSAFFAGVRLICQTIASLPIMTYQRIGETKKRKYREHPVYGLLHDCANTYTPAFYWVESSTYHQIIYGNSYSYIDRDLGYRPRGLYLLNPQYMTTFIDPIEKVVKYEFRKGSDYRIYEYDEILHIPGFGFDGLQGYSILKLAAESLGLGLAFEEFNGRFLGQGAHVGGVLQTDKSLSPESRKNLKDSFTEQYSGLGKTGKTILLEDGIKYNATGMPLSDAQFLESRIFQIDEIARWLGLPPHKLAEQTHATYSNVEAENLSFYQDSIRPYLVRDEAFLNMDIAPSDGYCEFLFDAILRADVKSRNEAFNIQRNAGIINADEWRSKENLDEIGGEAGQTYIIPSNMTTIEKIIASQEQKPAQDKTNDMGEMNGN